MKIAFLGLGKMGPPVVERLLQAGHDVTVWNRTPKSFEELQALGISSAIVAPTIQAAVTTCDVACTMLADDAATEAVVLDAQGLLKNLPSHSVHISMGTLSVALSRRLMELHAQAGQHFVAAPVFGRPTIARQGRLWIVAAGDAATITRVRSALNGIGRGLTIVGEEAWQAHAFKLAGNFLLSTMLQSLSEAFVFASSQKIDPELFLGTINEALFQSPLYANYGRVMLHPPDQPGATVILGEKDIRLMQDATRAAGIQLGLVEYLKACFEEAIRNGLGEMDWAVGQYRMAEQASKNS